MNDESMKDLYDKMKESIAKSNVTIGTGQGKKTPISLMSEEKDHVFVVTRLKERDDEKAESEVVILHGDVAEGCNNALEAAKEGYSLDDATQRCDTNPSERMPECFDEDDGPLTLSLDDETGEFHREGEPGYTPLDAIVDGVVTSRGETVIFTDNLHEAVAHIRSKRGATPAAVDLDELATKGSLVEAYHRAHADEGEPVTPSSEEEFHNIWCPDTTNRPFAQLIERTDEVAVKRDVMPDVSECDCTPPMGMVDDTHTGQGSSEGELIAVLDSVPQQEITVKPVKLALESLPVRVRSTDKGYFIGTPKDMRLLDRDCNEVAPIKKAEPQDTKAPRALGPRFHPTNEDSEVWSILLDEGTLDGTIPKRWLTVTKDGIDRTSIQRGSTPLITAINGFMSFSLIFANNAKDKAENLLEFTANLESMVDGQFNDDETLPDAIVMSVERFIAETKLGSIGRKGWKLAAPYYSLTDKAGNVLTPDVLITRTGTMRLIAKAYDLEVLGEGYRPTVDFYNDPDTIGESDDDEWQGII